MIASLIGAGLKVGGAIYGGIKKAQAMRQMQRQIQQQKQENTNWYNRRYNEDATQRADAVRALQKVEDSIKNRNRAAAGTQAVMGGTEESVAAAKAANNEALSQTASNIAAQADARKDAIEQQYRQEDSRLQGQLNQLQAQKAQNIAESVTGVAGAANSIASLDSGSAVSDMIKNPPASITGINGKPVTFETVAPQMASTTPQLQYPLKK